MVPVNECEWASQPFHKPQVCCLLQWKPCSLFLFRCWTSQLPVIAGKTVAPCHCPVSSPSTHTHSLQPHTLSNFWRDGGWCFVDPLSCRSINNCFKSSPCAPEWRAKMKNLRPYFAQVQSINFKFFFLFFLIFPWQFYMLVLLLFLLTMQAGMLGLTDCEANRTRPTGCTSPALCVHLSGCIELEERIQLHPTAVC